MKHRPEPRIVVLYGGVGEERSISLLSGRAVREHFPKFSGCTWTAFDIRDAAIPEVCDASRDVIFPVLHGEYGEDGGIQRDLEAAGFSFCGSDRECSELCMNKARTKDRLTSARLPVVPGCVSHVGKPPPDPELLDSIGMEFVVKPESMGSSVGLHIFDNADSVIEFFDRMGNRQQNWIVERRIRGREFSVGVLDGKAMGVVEIVVPPNRVYDFEQKYHRDDTRYECPAGLPDDETARVKAMAEQVFEVCGCRDYARIDFLREPDQALWYCLELNTAPGLTAHSLLPKSAGDIGLSFEGLLERMIRPAIERFRAD